MEPWPAGKCLVIREFSNHGYFKVNDIATVLARSSIPSSDHPKCWTKGTAPYGHLLFQQTTTWEGQVEVWHPVAWMVPLEIDPDEESLYKEKEHVHSGD